MRLEDAADVLSSSLRIRRIAPRDPVQRTAVKRELAFSLDARKTPVLLWLVERRHGLCADVRTNLDPNVWSTLSYEEPNKEKKTFGGFRHWTATIGTAEDLTILIQDLEKVLDEDPDWRMYPVERPAGPPGGPTAADVVGAVWARVRELEANPTSAGVGEAVRGKIEARLAAMDPEFGKDEIAALASSLLLSPEELIRRGRAVAAAPGLLDALDALVKHATAERQRIDDDPLVAENRTPRDLFGQVTDQALKALGQGPNAAGDAKGAAGARPSPVVAQPHPGNAPEAAYRDLLARCRDLLAADAPDFSEDDFLRNLFLTVLDFQMHGTAVAKAVDHFDVHRRAEVPHLDALKKQLERFPKDEPGNREAARFLWGNNCWTRLELLRRLIAFFDSVGVQDQQSLRDWVAASTFESDFRGRVHGLAARVYEWLRIRVGVDDIKMDVWVQRFVEQALGPAVSLKEAKGLLLRAATELGVSPRRLDALIWWVTSGRGQV